MKSTPPALPERGEMLRALMQRDASCDGLFYAGVTSTMIFCRPSCPARKPHERNVQFYATPREALFAGFRPCSRCRPLEIGDSPAAPWLKSLLAEVEGQPARRLRDSELRARGLEPAAVRRYFQKNYGLTFQAYCRARRLGQAFSAIRAGGSIDDAVFDHGWESHSGFREAFSRAVQAPPGEARNGDCIRLAWIETPLGPMVAGATGTALCLLEFSDRRMLEAQLQTLRRRYRLPLFPGESPLFERLRSQLAEYFAGRRRTFDLPLDFRGTEFQKRVWEALLAHPLRPDPRLRGAGRGAGPAGRRPGRGAGQRPEPHRHPGALPPGGERRRRAGRLRRRAVAQAAAPGDREGRWLKR